MHKKYLVLFIAFLVCAFVVKRTVNAEPLTPYEITATVTLPDNTAKTFEYTPNGTRQVFKSSDECMKYIGSDEFAPMLGALTDMTDKVSAKMGGTVSVTVNCIAIPVPDNSI